MWYTSPGSASDWENTSLVIGNGKTGGILFGQVANDQIHFNEKTLWTGGPSESRPNYDGGNRDEAVTEEQLEALRQKMDDHSEAVFPQGTSTTTEVWGDGAGMGQYQDFGDLYLDFSAGGMTNDNVENYVRDLDMRTGISSVNYDYEGVHYEREYFASHPDHAVVTRLTASEAGKISFTASVRSASGLTTTTKAENGKITLAGEVNDNQMKCEMQAQIVNEGGTLTNNEDGTVTVENADAVTIVYSTDTDYKNEYPVYRTGESAEELSASLAETVDAAAAIELNSSYNDANAVYEARDTEEDWATYITTAADLKNQIDAAAALLAEEDCTVSELNAMKTAVDTAKDTLTGLWDRLTVTFTPESGQLEGEGLVTLSSEFDDLQIRYTTDGNDPMSFSALYEEPIAISGKQMTIKAALFSGVRRMSDVFTGVYDIGNERVNLALTAQEVTTSDNYDSAHDGWKAVDGNSYEPSRWATTDGTKEAQLELTFAEPVTVDGAGLIQYNMNTSDRNIITDFNIEYWDGEQWIAVIEGASMGNNGMQHEWSGNFEAVTSDRFRLNIVEGADPSVYEFELYKPVEIQSVETDKEILQSVISYAETAIENGQVDAAIEDVQKSFMEVYEYAVTVNENPSSSQDTIDRTWNAMLTELHKLGFFAGDKSGLQEHYNLYSALDLELYIDGAEKTAFIEALKTAENVLKDGNAMQEDVTAADQKLLDAAAALVLKADKTALQKLVDVASGYEEDNYLSTGWGTFENALANANEVLNDEMATQEEVDNAKSLLVQAMASLRYKADKSVLEEVLNKANNMDVTGYDAQKVAVFKAAVANAESVYADENLSVYEQPIVDAAVLDLQNAIAALEDPDQENPGSGDPEEPGQTTPGGNNDTDKPDQPKPGDNNDENKKDPATSDKGDGQTTGDNDTQRNDNQNTSDSKTVQTGDTTNIWMPVAGLGIAVVAIAGLGVVVYRRRRK